MAVGGFRLNQTFATIRSAVGNYSQVAARQIAEKLVSDLAKASPYYSGEFADNWVVIAGNTPVAPNTPPTEPRPKQRQSRKKPVLPIVPSLRGTGQLVYTIGNTMEYRDIAMDLLPGRTEKGQRLSAPQDWYLKYLRYDLPRVIRSYLDQPADLTDYVGPSGRNFGSRANKFPGRPI